MPMSPFTMNSRALQRFALPVGLVATGLVVYEAWRVYSRLSLEAEAKILTTAYDEEVQPALAEVVEEEFRVGEVTAGPDGDEPRVRFRPRRARRIAVSLAGAAYNEFGARDRDAANLLITRKYMRDLLREFKTLRHSDANAIIDVALYLSFLPSQALRQMNALDQTQVFEERAAPVASWRAWYFPFGPTGRVRAIAQ